MVCVQASAYQCLAEPPLSDICKLPNFFANTAKPMWKKPYSDLKMLSVVKSDSVQVITPQQGFSAGSSSRVITGEPSADSILDE